jgi:hypothetical protein
MPTLNTAATAALIWLSEGQKPTAASFGPETMILEDAVDRTTAEEDAHPDEWPWIKTEGKILGLNDIVQLKSGLRAVRTFRATRS